MDAMGIAGFGYHFNSLTSTSSDPHAPEDELAAAFATIFSSARKLRLITVFQAWFPILRRLRPDRHVMEHAQRVMGRIGSSLIAERTAYVLSEAKGSVTDAKSFLGRDLLSLMIKSSLSEEPSKQLSPSEALCQISTFLVAGHETTSNALSWALYALAKEPRIQQKLRDELRSLPISCVPGEEVSPEDVEAISRLPYLDSVIREVLRLHSPVTSTMRVCTREVDSVPMSIPFTDKHGTTRDTIELKKGDIISVPIQAINKSVKMWGPDAEEFLPERWLVENPAPEASAIPGVWSHILTFGNGNTLNGNRSCIGWRFALLE
jgi:cytochrome P450